MNIKTLNNKVKYLFGISTLLLITLFCLANRSTTKDNFNLAQQEILLRKIGHDILLHAGDSTSRVLPVKKMANNEYRIKFENEFAFLPDSLVQIVNRSLAKNRLSKNYIVNVLDCSGQDALFGYTFSNNEQKNIVPCAGRKQPKGCYQINIKFEEQGLDLTSQNYLIGGLSIFALMGLLFVTPFNSRNHNRKPAHNNIAEFELGNTLFDSSKRSISILGITTELTQKENKLLLIFASSPNTIIERSRLQKEIWEDEGVIVGRSLDMFISKLRKKLEPDNSLQIINIHGKGYKLQIDQQ